MKEDICIHPWKYAVEPFRIAGPLYYVGNKKVSSHLVDTGSGLILFDTTFPQTTYLLLESIRQLGFDPADIRLILHSHGHYDHFGGTRAIVELTEAKTAMGKDDIFILTERPELSWAPEYGVEFHETFTVDIQLSDRQKLEVGSITIECAHIPGHTPGNMSYFFRIQDNGRNYSVGFHGGHGIKVFADQYLLKYGLSYEARQQYLKSIEKMKARSPDIFIASHPSQDKTLAKYEKMIGRQNPFIDKQAWPAYLSQLEDTAQYNFNMLMGYPNDEIC